MKLYHAVPSPRALFAGLVVLFYSFVTSIASAAATWQNVQIGGGGYVPAVVFSQAAANVIYARTDMGGAYRWNQSTSTWIPLTDWVGWTDWHLLGCASIAADPLNANKVVIAAGMYTNTWDGSNGVMLRSNDQGATFTQTVMPFKIGGNMPGRGTGERLQYDPNNDNILYYAASDGNGLWKSTDGAATWSKVTSFPNVGNYAENPSDAYDYANHSPGVLWVTFDKRTGTSGNATQTIYVGVADLQNSLYVSTNGGTTWTRVAGQPTGFMAHHGVLDTVNGFLYLPYNNQAGPYDGASGDVWKYATATGVWTKISPVPSTDTANDYFGYGGLTIDKLNPTTVMVSALNSWWPDTRIWRSTNGGTTWSQIWDYTSYPSWSRRAILDVSSNPWLTTPGNFSAPEPALKYGWMVDDIEIDPFNSNRMFYGTGATLYGSTNLTNWDPATTATCTITPMVKGIEETAVLDLISPPSGSPLLSALGDIGGFNHTSLTTVPSSTYKQIWGTNRSIDFSELAPTNMVRTGDGGNTAYGDPGMSIALSSDGGANWYEPSSQPASLTGGGQAAVSCTNNQNIVWSPGGVGVYYSTTGGSSWTASTGIPAGASVRSDRATAGKFYGFLSGTFYVSTNNGATFAATAATGLPTYGQFKAVFGIAGDIWLVGQFSTSPVTGGVWHSTNSGVSFTKLSNVAVGYTIGFGKAASGQTYPALYLTGLIGSTYGIYQSDDAGTSWTQINDSAHQYGTLSSCITGDRNTYGRCYVGTNGRGIIYSTATTTADFTLSDSPTSVSLAQSSTATTTITVNKLNSFAGSVTLSASGLPTGVTATFGTNPTTATSLVTFTASSTATVGTSTVTITGVSGSLSHTTTVGLTVTAPATADFTLSDSPTTVSVVRSATATTTVTVNKLNSFAGSVSLSASGLPTGVTATFGTNPTTATSVVTFTASSTATVGTSTVTITGVSGTLTHTTTVSLTVTAAATADFTLSDSPATVSVAQSATATTTVTVNKLNSFAGSVTLSASGLPTGVTATFGTNPTTATSVVTFTASSTATAGTSTVTITGVSGTLTHTTTLSLTVTAAGGIGGGGVTATIANSLSGWYNDQSLVLANTATITALTVTITIQSTQGVTYNNQYNNIGSQITNTHSGLVYTFTLASGQTLGAGTNKQFHATTNGNGTTHVSTADTWSITYTTGGVAYTNSGHF